MATQVPNWVSGVLGAIVAGCGLICFAVMKKADQNRPTGAIGFTLPPSTRVPSAAPEPSAGCDARTAATAILRDRATVAECLGRTIQLVRAANSPGAIEILGWSAEDSEDGPPCLARFQYNLHGSRRTMRWALFPGDPSRIASMDSDSGSSADLCDAMLLGGATAQVTEAQLAMAGMWRLTGRRVTVDAYMDPHEAGTLLVRRQHCVAGNVDVRSNQATIRSMRTAQVRRMRCIGADENWAQDIPPRGPISEPYLLPATP